LLIQASPGKKKKKRFQDSNFNRKKLGVVAYTCYPTVRKCKIGGLRSRLAWTYLQNNQSKKGRELGSSGKWLHSKQYHTLQYHTHTHTKDPTKY
jgi:hypothetical protein